MANDKYLVTARLIMAGALPLKNPEISPGQWIKAQQIVGKIIGASNETYIHPNLLYGLCVHVADGLNEYFEMGWKGAGGTIVDIPTYVAERSAKENEAVQDYTPNAQSVVKAAIELLAAMDQTAFYDLGINTTGSKPEDGLDDADAIDGGSAQLTAGHIRRLRAAVGLKGACR